MLSIVCRNVWNELVTRSAPKLFGIVFHTYFNCPKHFLFFTREELVDRGRSKLLLKIGPDAG